MAVIFMDGFDTGETLNRWVLAGTNIGDITHISGTRFGTGKAVKMLRVPLASTCSITRMLAGISTIYVGAAIKVVWGVYSTYTPTPNLFGLFSDNGVTGHLYIRRMTNDALALYRGDPMQGNYGAPSGSLLATTQAGVFDGNWHYIEMSATLNDTTGHVIVRIDGTQVIDFTGDTRNGGTSTNIDSVCFKTGQYVSGQCDEIDIDDFYINDSGFLGDVRVHTLMPSADTAAADFAPTGSASHFANVSENPDSAATYNASATVGHKDLYAMADLPASVATIHAVQANNKAWKTDAGVIRLKNVIKSGANTASGDVVSLGTSAAINSSLFATDPATSAAWTTTGVNGVEAGVEVA